MNLSEPKLISPLLNGFHMGDAISDRYGVRSYPAMPQDSDEKYIVKIISIPANQNKVQALLFAGAFSDEAAAGDYFRELADDVLKECDVLERLSRMEGFLPFTGVQKVPMEKAVGWDVYLLSPYRSTLARFLSRSNMTHLAAINLGLDMCASLAVCRQMGYLYANLKPENIYICHDHEYRIGDLGFLKLDSLQYTSIPERYISSCTPPEIVDAYSDLNTTLDTYGAGMILYRVYNGGELPFKDRVGSEPLPPPAYADYELSEIIMKAIAPDPKDRWQDPIAMGQALVAYMQRNGVNDTPIVAIAEEAEPFEPEQEITEEEEELSQEIMVEGEAAAEDQEIPDLSELDEEPEEPTEQVCLDDFYAYFSEENQEEAEASEEDAPAPEENEADPDADLLNLSFLDDLVSDDTTPSEEMASDIGYSELTDELTDILAQADDLLSHETPEGVVAPEAPEIPMPDPIDWESLTPAPQPEPEPEPAPVAVAEKEEPQVTDDFDEDFEEAYLNEISRQRTTRKWIAWVVVLLLLIGMAFGGYVFYRDYYLQTVHSLTVKGSEDQMVVTVDSTAEDALLSVVCTDTYGNPIIKQVLGGQAVFTNLNPNTLYTVKVQITGMHKLIGEISGSYTTPVQTNVVSVSTVTGNEPGTAIVSFTVDGMDSETWALSYKAPGVAEQKVIFSGHMVNLTGLESGKTYSFRLEPGTELYLTGKTEWEYTAMDPVFAEDLAITAVTANSLTVSWTLPEGAYVTGWTVRCYSESGYDQTVQTTGTTLVFEGINGNEAHTVEVVSDGTNSGVRCYMTAGALTVSNIRFEPVDPVTMKLVWDFAGNAPANDWIITYQAINADYLEMARSDTNSILLTPMIPGTGYQVSILLEDGTTIFSEPVVLQVPEAPDLDMHLLTRSHITAHMVKTPNKSNWGESDLKKSDYTDTFKAGEKASFLLKASRTYNPEPDPVDIMYVIHDSEGKLISSDIVKHIWRNMWYKRVCELDVPALPEVPGDYQITFYFNGQTVHSQQFHVQ